MKTFKRVFSLVFTSIVLALSVYSVEKNNSSNINFWSDYPHEELASYIVDNMSDEELLAQILMFGWAGSEPSELVMNWINYRAVGSLKVYGWGTNNVVDVAKSVVQVQKASENTRFKIPLYIATDQEGGWIRHIKGATSDTPGNLAIGASGLLEDAFYSGYFIAKELACMGVNMNFAPTVDIYSDLKSTVIGPRSFGSDAENVASLGASFTAGMMKAGVIPTAKHFPGHGDTRFDSHGRLPEINIDRETFENRELVPFKYLIKENVPAIMVGHLCFPKVSGNREPATLSKYFVTDLLRGQLGYKGLIITDDMMMYGASSYAGSLTRSVRMAIQAGNDIVISSTTAQFDDDLWVSNLAYMKTNADFKQCVKNSAYNVILSKLKYFKGENCVPIYPDVEKVAQSIPDPQGEKFFLSQACKSLTVYNGDAQNLKIENVDSSQIMIAGQYQSFIREGQKKFANAKTFYYNYNMGPNEQAWTAARFEQLCQNCSVVILGCANESAMALAQVAEKLAQSGKRVVIVSMLAPTYFMENQWKSEILMCYSYSPYSFRAVFSALNGEFVPKGILSLEKTE